MKKKKANKRMLFVLVPMLGISLAASLMTPRSVAAPGPGIEFNEPSSASSANYDVDDQKHEAPANHEPVFMSIFKFIVNCNPFRKEANL